ncbi:PREDICTED: RING finger protein 17-like [Propithecus coquereli]|uniref:RING finger protein 17-like n=1 Tax=Propithecus coquereli TaxID=379532 RepID=UPI00063F47BB|nr:PREDICTED: RING finger protein 17-like [Propithecus coquereli]
MAAEASTAQLAMSFYPHMGSRSRSWGAAEIQCTRCGRRVPRASGEGPRVAPAPQRVGGPASGRQTERGLARPPASPVNWGAGPQELPPGRVSMETALRAFQEPQPTPERASLGRVGGFPPLPWLSPLPKPCLADPPVGGGGPAAVASLLSVSHASLGWINNCSQDFKKTADQLTIGLEHSASTHRTVSNSSAIMSEIKTSEEIDEALKIAGYNFEQLSIAVKMLEHIENQTREETESVLEVVEKQFDQLFTSLNSRKKNLCEELVRNRDDYLSNLTMTKSYIEEKKNDLDAVMKIARELKSAPSLRTYCDLNQIIRTLTLTLESELSQVSSLKRRNPPRLIMNCSEIICMFNDMGKIEFEDLVKCYPQENEIGQNVQKKYNIKKELSCHDTYPSLEKKKVDTSVLTGEAPLPPLQPEPSDVHLEAKNFPSQKEVVAMTSPKTIAMLPQMGSSPDVIIEEIIEENLETYFTGYPVETPRYPKNPLQKNSSVPFGSKAGTLTTV